MESLQDFQGQGGAADPGERLRHRLCSGIPEPAFAYWNRPLPVGFRRAWRGGGRRWFDARAGKRHEQNPV